MEAAPVYSDTKLPILHIKVVSRGFIMLTLSTKTLSKYMNLINTLLPQYFTLFLERNFQHEAGFATATAKHMRTVITECITSEMVQDANMSNMSDDDELPALKQIIAAFHNSLNIKNKNNLDVVLALLGDLFQRLGKKSYPVMRPIVLTLDQLRDNSDDFKLIGSLERAIGAAISAMGPKHLLSILPLNINSQADGNVRGWMLELLKDYTINTNLQFFIDDIIPLVQHFQTRANKEGNSEFGRNLNALVDQLWATLPGFCTFPTDFAKSFKTVAGDMSTHLMHAQHVNIICTALLRLIQRTKVVLSAGHAPEGVDFSVTAAQEVLDGMAKYSKNFLPILFNLYTGDHQTVHKDIVARTVNAFCQISTSETVDEYFKQVLHKLLTITTDNEEQTQRKYMFTDLALSMITLNLTPKALELLYKLILPQIASKRDHTTQKKAYRAFLLISQSVPLFFQEHLDEILKQFKTSLESLHSSAKKYRIRCLCRVIASPVIIENYEKLSAYIPQLLVEGILNSTEVNTQTQQYSSKMLRALLNRICEIEINDDDSDDEETEEEEAAFVVPKSMNANQQERLCAFFKSMTSGLGGASDTMISATINVLSTLVHDYGDFIEPVIPDLLASVAVLIDYDNKDVTMAVIQFMKMALGLLDAEFLKQYMATVLRGMLHQAGQKGAGVIRTRVKYMIEKMLKKFGYEFVASIWPATEKISYLNNLNKQNKKKGPEGRRIVKAKRKLSTGVTLSNEKNQGEVLDLMDPTTVNRISAKKNDNEMKDDKDDDVEIEVNKSGKLVIRDLKDDDVVEDSKKEKKTKKQATKKRGRESEENLAMDDYEVETGDKEEDTPRNEQDERASKRGRSENGGSFNTQRYLQRKQQERDQARHKGPKNTANLGTDYKAKHRGTGGDMKRKGKADPYAYVPLDAGRLNKRSRNTESNFDKLERGGSKGTRGRGRR
jgi:ribosomal RNA-processing protein 12